MEKFTKLKMTQKEAVLKIAKEDGYIISSSLNSNESKIKAEKL